MTATAGFLLAARGEVDFGLLIAMLVGISLVIASACVCNNYMDRSIDQHMSRTNQRALVSGVISGRSALTFASVLGISGMLILIIWVNLLAAALGAFGFLAYVFIYGYFKRRSVYGTIVGSISGAVPPVVGYAAVTNSLDVAALILFLILVLWQMPHFYAIAIFRQDDYKAADIPVLPLVSGRRVTKLHIIAYIVAFITAAGSLSVFGYTSVWFALTVFIIGGMWMWHGFQGLATDDDVRWARKSFSMSLIVISLLCLAIGIDSFYFEQA